MYLNQRKKLKEKSLIMILNLKKKIFIKILDPKSEEEDIHKDPEEKVEVNDTDGSDEELEEPNDDAVFLQDLETDNGIFFFLFFLLFFLTENKVVEIAESVEETELEIKEEIIENKAEICPLCGVSDGANVVGCDCCSNWYHQGCLDHYDVQVLKEDWQCPVCQMKSGCLDCSDMFSFLVQEFNSKISKFIHAEAPRTPTSHMTKIDFKTIRKELETGKKNHRMYLENKKKEKCIHLREKIKRKREKNLIPNEDMFDGEAMFDDLLENPKDLSTAQKITEEYNSFFKDLEHKEKMHEYLTVAEVFVRNEADPDSRLNREFF
eukprot:TRINITY_DN319_c0_g2_i21.p1 TRINITY_DN319_c0_g2~~TRINITY_DN319_c0_g2_i21.p1  ORF type:complete len:321 (-),score=50.96 TRINITY_DN319_c0_g2_i21:763-1725(-)